MNTRWITFQHVFDGERIHDDASVRIEDGHIAELDFDGRSGLSHPGYLVPGYLDLQVNGGGGVQLNATPTSHAMTQIAQAHRGFGTVGILPTVITDAPEVLEKAARAALSAKGMTGILGLHIEGPHLSKSRRGTHKGDFIRRFSPRTLEIVEKLRDAGITVMITVAPEEMDLADIAKLSAIGAIVSVGHTDASADQIEAAVVAGACCGTHLFNAMSPMTTREPGAVGAVLHSGIHFGIICDGFHVDDRMISLALRAGSNPDAAFLVSDSMATVGGPDSFELYGQPVHLENGRLINREGNLAGAHITQAQGVKRLVQEIGVSHERAFKMATTIPAKVIGRPDLATLVGRPICDVLVLNGKLDVTDNAVLAPQFDAAE